MYPPSWTSWELQAGAAPSFFWASIHLLFTKWTIPGMCKDQSPEEQLEKGEALRLHSISPSFLKRISFPCLPANFPYATREVPPNKNIDVTLSKVSAANVLRITCN